MQLGNGAKEEEGFTLVNLNHSQVFFLRDSYIVASQTKQMFYLREDDSSTWYVSMIGPSRRFRQKEFEDGTVNIRPLPTTVDIDVDLDEADNERSDCEGIY